MGWLWHLTAGVLHGTVEHRCRAERYQRMASKPEIPEPDTIQPQSPPEMPPPVIPADEPMKQPPEIVPNEPDRDRPHGIPEELPSERQDRIGRS